ncbi:MAG: glycosyltransferase [Actinomycetia bacterium]|nr:glycosyltransferase [Actinomycetes bacterium]
MGTDGSGKTTLSSALVNALREDGVDATREWLAAESYLMAPLRGLLRLRWRKAETPDCTEPGVNYTREVAQKHAVVARHRWAKRLYLALVFLDYRMQLSAKLIRSHRRDVLVADRYLFDVVVNVALTLGLSTEEAVELVQRQIARLPLPQVRVFLRVDPEVSMERKDDIPDIEYLRLRLQYYEAIAAAFGFVVLNGTRPIQENCGWLRDHVVESLAKPYVHYVHANNDDVGGADLVLVSMARHMRSWGPGYRTTVSLRLATTAAQAHADVGTPVMLAPVVRPQLSAGLRGLFNLAIRGPLTVVHFLRLFGREQPDIVHVNDLYEFLPAIAARIRRIPVVYHIRMIRPAGIVRDGFRWLLPRISSKIISISRAVRREYDPEGSQGDRQCIIHDLGNTTLVEFTGDVTKTQPRPPGLIPGERLVVMVGRIQGWKGQRVFLDAIRKLPDDLRRRHAFVLVGGGVEGRSDLWGSPDYLREVVTDAELLGVQWLGARDDVPALLLAADISVHCSVRPEPWGMVVIESLLAGAATIASDAGGVPEIIQAAEVGVLYPPGDAIELSKHLLKLLTLEETPRALYSVAARNRGLQLVSGESVGAQLDELYRSLLVGPSRSAIQPHFPRRETPATRGETPATRGETPATRGED